MRKTLNIVSILPITFMLCLLICSSGCTDSKDTDTAKNQNDLSASESYKIKSVINDKDKNSITFELYYDGKSYGEGLLGVSDITYDTFISDNKIYVKFDDDTIACIEGLTPFLMVEGDTIFNNPNCTYDNGKIKTYNKITDEGISMNNQYGEAEHNSSYHAVDSSIEVTLSDFPAYANDIARVGIEDISSIGEMVESSSSDGEEPSSEEPIPESFYALSRMGITIRGKKFSVGDYVNPDTYFFNEIPEGATSKFEHDKDERIEVIYYTYMDSTGRVELKTIKGNVYAVYADSDCSLLDFYTGMPEDDVKRLLGIGLKKKEEATFKPIVEGIEVVSSKSGVYIFTLDGLTAELSCKDKLLKSIRVYKESFVN